MPKTLKKIDEDAFSECGRLLKIYIEDNCKVSFSDIRVLELAQVGPLPETIVRNVRVWDFRYWIQVVIPEETEIIGSYWFWGSGIESVTVPASVREIGVDAFCNCKCLRKVVLAKGSQLKSVGKRCFYNSGIEEFTFPSALREIGADAFGKCKSLKVTWVETGCSVNVRKNLDDLTLILPVKKALTKDQCLWDFQ